MISRAGWGMDMESSTWLQSPISQSAQLTSYDFKSRTEMDMGIISMITVSNIPECTTYCLWLPEQDEKLTWNNQHDYSQQHARMHNLLPMIARAGWRMDMESSVWLQSLYTRMHNLPPQIDRVWWRMDMEWLVWSQSSARMHNSPPKIARAEWTWIIGMVTVTNVPECATHPLWLP